MDKKRKEKEKKKYIKTLWIINAEINIPARITINLRKDLKVWDHLNVISKIHNNHISWWHEILPLSLYFGRQARSEQDTWPTFMARYMLLRSSPVNQMRPSGRRVRKMTSKSSRSFCRRYDLGISSRSYMIHEYPSKSLQMWRSGDSVPVVVVVVVVVVVGEPLMMT